MAGTHTSSSLTPDMARLGTNISASCNPTTGTFHLCLESMKFSFGYSAGLRKLVQDCLEKVRSNSDVCLPSKFKITIFNKQMFDTAIFLSEKLCRMAAATISDHVLYAKVVTYVYIIYLLLLIFAQCFQLSGEHRRCLVTLEHKGLLGVDVIAPLSEALKVPDKSPSQKSRNAADHFLSPSQHSQLSAVYLAASCLFRLEEYEDCIAFLEPFIDVEDDRTGAPTALHLRRVIPIQPSAVHVMAGEWSNKE
jgi:hypothetical protein